MSRSKKQRLDPGKQGENSRLYGMIVLVLLAGVFMNYRQILVGLEQPNTTKLREGNY